MRLKAEIFVCRVLYSQHPELCLLCSSHLVPTAAAATSFFFYYWPDLTVVGYQVQDPAEMGWDMGCAQTCPQAHTSV